MTDNPNSAALPVPSAQPGQSDQPSQSNQSTSSNQSSALSRARVVLLAGPSGAGKSRLAERLATAYGWPIVRLDDFYRDHDDPQLPRSQALGGMVDWDHSDSWNREAAMRALAELVDTGATQTPVYDISQSRAVARTTTTCRPTDLVVAEGIFAAELAAPLRAAGLLHTAWCVRGRPAVTAIRRLARDLNERRKPPMVLLRRGWELMRREPRVVARAERFGATAATAREVEAHLVGAAGTYHGGAAAGP